MKFLVDECLSPALVNRLQTAGYQATHVTHLNKSGWSDQALMAVILDADWTFITGNAFDFRGPAGTPGSSGGYSGAKIHAGLICLNRPYNDSRRIQLELLEEALSEINELEGDLVNQVLEVTLHDDDTIEATVYGLPT
ncbi:hypothetical protein CKO28_05865 [Rhodovibrio sodomensis]|uniref:DUF5615 domain-containing protein n=1 Tax=Rhodovibrio sodomensis TaxID=1088 RepID=A0ABS1DAT5_9PROT|nr:DUF5615 family PIN-like protein [Rhodovibrio sodomensis]MBK1667557.1 hypothetical protein [Rhodovibrio sodomensis]